MPEAWNVRLRKSPLKKFLLASEQNSKHVGSYGPRTILWLLSSRTGSKKGHTSLIELSCHHIKVPEEVFSATSSL
jgi:hypothetical protein